MQRQMQSLCRASIVALQARLRSLHRYRSGSSCASKSRAVTAYQRRRQPSHNPLLFGAAPSASSASSTSAAAASVSTTPSLLMWLLLLLQHGCVRMQVTSALCSLSDQLQQQHMGHPQGRSVLSTTRSLGAEVLVRLGWQHTARSRVSSLRLHLGHRLELEVRLDGSTMLLPPGWLCVWGAAAPGSQALTSLPQLTSFVMNALAGELCCTLQRCADACGVSAVREPQLRRLLLRPPSCLRTGTSLVEAAPDLIVLVFVPLPSSATSPAKLLVVCTLTGDALCSNLLANRIPLSLPGSNNNGVVVPPSPGSNVTYQLVWEEFAPGRNHEEKLVKLFAAANWIPS